MSLEKITNLSWIYDLHRLAQSSTTSDDITEIYQHLLAHIVDGFGAKSGCLALRIDGQKDLTVVAGIDLPGGVIGNSIEIGTGLLGWVVKENSALLMNGGLASNSKFMHKAASKEAAHHYSSVCWPLKIEDTVIGGVCVHRPAELPEYVESDLEQGTFILNLVSLALSNIQLQTSQQRKIELLKEANRRLEDAQNHLLQVEKMASIGQMAAGVAHEINNPIGFVSSNLGSLEKYISSVFEILKAYEEAEIAFSGNEAVYAGIQALKQKVDLTYLRQDIPSLINESREGINRVKTIVQNLKDFSRIDSSDEWQFADLHQGIQSTINIVWNQLKYKAQIKKEFGNIPQVECLPSQLNQVYLNMLVNAGHAIGEQGVITIRTFKEGEEVVVSFSDTGCGIKPENLQRIFDPFFTTKKVGEGTGLGLSVSYGIVQKHHGKIDVQSEPGKGTTFTIRLPVRRPEHLKHASSPGQTTYS